MEWRILYSSILIGPIENQFRKIVNLRLTIFKKLVFVSGVRVK